MSQTKTRLTAEQLRKRLTEHEQNLISRLEFARRREAEEKRDYAKGLYGGIAMGYEWSLAALHEATDGEFGKPLDEQCGGAR